MIKKAFSNGAANLFISAGSFVYTKLLISSLGLELYGGYNFIIAVTTSVLTLVDFGFQNILTTWLFSVDNLQRREATSLLAAMFITLGLVLHILMWLYVRDKVVTDYYVFILIFLSLLLSKKHSQY